MEEGPGDSRAKPKNRKRSRRRSPSPSDEEDFGEAEFVEDDVVVYHSTRFNKDFRFKKCVPGGSTMIAGAFEYWCLDCDSLEKPGVLETVLHQPFSPSVV
ncbi:hypothetical protein AAVH_17976 [Aphelenchoides avenae]|nr:hypothetical protein AAVH_17976 [Aphelenchus avenae]